MSYRQPTKAIVTDAGFASRFLPITKTIPKAMLPIGNRPVSEVFDKTDEENPSAAADQNMDAHSESKPSDTVKANVMRLLKEKYGMEEEDFASFLRWARKAMKRDIHETT